MLMSDKYYKFMGKSRETHDEAMQQLCDIDFVANLAQSAGAPTSEFRDVIAAFANASVTWDVLYFESSKIGWLVEVAFFDGFLTFGIDIIKENSLCSFVPYFVMADDSQVPNSQDAFTLMCRDAGMDLYFMDYSTGLYDWFRVTDKKYVWIGTHPVMPFRAMQRSDN